MTNKPSINDVTLEGNKSLSDLGIQPEIDSSHKLSADNISDGSTNKVVTASEKTTWSGKQDALVSGTNIKTINNKSLLGAGNISISGEGGTGVGFSCWEGKTAVCVGDSITAGSGTTQIYYNILKDILGFSQMTGMGVAGSCVSAKSNYGSSNSPLINRWQSIPDRDLITIYMGTNDYGHNTPLGTIADTTDISFYGALNVIIPGILTAHPNSRLVWITPTHRDGFGSGFTHDWVANGAGKTLKDYVDAIKEVCERYSVPVIDLFSISGLEPVIPGIKSTYMPDGLHPNALAHNKIAVYMAKYLNLYSDLVPTAQEAVAVTGVTLNKATTTVSASGTDTLIATLTPASASNRNVAWSIVSGSEYVSITPNGLNCTINGLAEGTAVIRVTTADGGYTAQCTATVTSSTIPVTGVALSGLDNIRYGSSTTLTATITPANATNQTVTWTITSGSEYVQLTPNGLTCLVDGIGVGSADITVTTQDGNFSDTMTLTVAQAPTDTWTMNYGNRYSPDSSQQVNHARLTPDSKNYYFAAGQVVSLDDNVTYKWQMCLKNGETDLSTISQWQIPNQPGEQGGGWTTTQSYTIPTSGYYAIAFLKADGSDFDLSTESSNAFDYITVSGSAPVPVTGVSITGDSSVTEGSSITLTAIVSPSNADDKSVTWAIESGSSYASISASNDTCTVTGIAEGTVVVGVTTTDGGFTSSKTIAVQSQPPASTWELDYGNRYSGTEADWTSHARLSPKNEAYYFEAGQTIELDDNVSYKWNITGRSSASDFTPASWLISGGWVQTKSYTFTTSGYYGIALLKADGTDFDLTTDSNNAFDYFTVS